MSDFNACHNYVMAGIAVLRYVYDVNAGCNNR